MLAQVLAVRRASVNEVARTLAEDGCITYTRGEITVLDRTRLEDNACSCYTSSARTSGLLRGPAARSACPPRRPTGSNGWRGVSQADR